jgi:hypothetical protein
MLYSGTASESISFFKTNFGVINIWEFLSNTYTGTYVCSKNLKMERVMAVCHFQDSVQL